MFVFNNRSIEYIIVCSAGDTRILLYLDQFQLTINKKETLKRRLLKEIQIKEDYYLLVRQGLALPNDGSVSFISQSAKNLYFSISKKSL